MKTRKGKTVFSDDKVVYTGESINQAKRYMRTGSGGSQPAKVIESRRVGAYSPKGKRE